MSRLKVYWPDEVCEETELSGRGLPAVLQFPDEPARRQPRRPRFLDVLERARLLRENAVCQYCSYPVVEPIELQDGATSRGNLPIPGSATLVGFRCTCCRAEWPV